MNKKKKHYLNENRAKKKKCARNELWNGEYKNYNLPDENQKD